MSISSPEQFEKLRACGMIVGKALRAMAAAVRPAITTAELCEIGSRVLAKHGARSSPPMVYGFPGDVCISVNDEVVHGIPGERVLQPDRKSTRLNSSHGYISYAVFCLKKKKKQH